ncbi:hypothetical protein [Bacillus sp. V59.32b]|uniref:hypothetical protein n=1 Tax=Bacillus sp. V59.32b TaxID=1758642 RepID=UPI000E3E93D6|nr:hypothetical protein [Bacillus sp. V59.32b]RFU66131.1 hypothetical protein D0463_09675 [Bacillus sp. V59.32b]
MFKTGNQAFAFLYILLFVLIVGGCDPFSKDNSESHQSPACTDLSNEHIQSISLKSTKDDVTNVLGEPDFVEEIENPKSTYFIYGKDESDYDVDFLLEEGKVQRIYLSSNKYKTAKGVAVGSHKSEVIDAYGDNYYERTEKGAPIIGYFDKVNHINMEFGFSEDRVTGIIVAATRFCSGNF